MQLSNAKCYATRQVVGGGFLFSNPNAKKTCGCSRTFDVKVRIRVRLRVRTLTLALALALTLTLTRM